MKKDEIDLSQVLLDIQNHIKDEESFEYDKSILDKKNFIVTPNSIERIKKISYYISRGIPVLLEGPSGTSKTFSSEFACLVAFKYGQPLHLDEINLGSQAVLECIEEALDSEIISIEVPLFPLTIIRKHPNFA